jgi:Fic family protein
MPTPLGYSELIERYQLRALPLATVAMLDTGIKGRQFRQQGGQQIELFEPKYQPENNLQGHLQFALRYEAVNLQVLALLFARTGEKELVQWLSANPESRFARGACYLYEWLTGNILPIEDPVSPRSRYVALADPALQFVASTSTATRQTRFRILNNLPGPREFCPLIRNTPFLKAMVSRDLRRLTKETLESFDKDLLQRAAAYLYLKETQSSFEVERETPSPQRTQRFADMLRQADTKTPLTEDRVVELQPAVVDPRFHEFSWRREQNWIGKDQGYRQQVDFVPPRPADLSNLMSGLLAMAASFQTAQDTRTEHPGDPVIAAAAIAFGFVFIHPFMDGNGRIHRYLIHDVLAKAGFTPRGIVLPVSAVILANLNDYIDTLEQFSRPVNQLTEYDPAQAGIPATGNDSVYFQYPDLTAQTEFLYKALERTVTQDLQNEINYLLGFDRASRSLNKLLDWPAHSMELFIRAVLGNAGKLSTNKRKSHFLWMHEDEIRQAEAEVQTAFTLADQAKAASTRLAPSN